MALKRKATSVIVASTSASAPTSILAASSTVTRYIRSIHPTNNDSSARTWNLEYGSSTLTAANSDVFGESIAANTRAYPIYYGGGGRRIDNVQISAFASAASVVMLDVVYDESDTVDA